MYRFSRCLKTVPTVFLLVACGCALNNGLPGDLVSLFSDSGIEIHILEAHAPIDSRAGFVRIENDEILEAAIVEAFDMTPIDLQEPVSVDLAGRAGVTPAVLWGVTGDTPRLHLENGGRFIYLYLLITADGQVFIFAEYAYG